MKYLALAALALTLAACGREPTAGPIADESLTLVPGGPPLTCAVNYEHETGPMKRDSLAVVTLALDTGALSPGWSPSRLLVTKPLEDETFDPWLPFRESMEQPFVARDGALYTLSDFSGSPLTLDTSTGALSWRSDGVLGAMSYSGVCQ